MGCRETDQSGGRFDRPSLPLLPLAGRLQHTGPEMRLTSAQIVRFASGKRQ